MERRFKGPLGFNKVQIFKKMSSLGIVQGYFERQNVLQF